MNNLFDNLLFSVSSVQQIIPAIVTKLGIPVATSSPASGRPRPGWSAPSSPPPPPPPQCPRYCLVGWWFSARSPRRAMVTHVGALRWATVRRGDKNRTRVFIRDEAHSVFLPCWLSPCPVLMAQEDQGYTTRQELQWQWLAWQMEGDPSSLKLFVLRSHPFLSESVYINSGWLRSW